MNEYNPDYESWFEWLWSAEQAVCKHPKEHWHDESWSTPDSGGDGGYCDLCGWMYRHVMY